MNTPARRFILLVICVVVAAAAFMAPRRDEWFAMMRDEDKQAQIIAMLEPRLARDGDDPYVLATLARSYAESNRPARAAELLERYLVLRPDDHAAYARLADLYKSTGNAAKRIAMLTQSLMIKPNLQRALELAELYRMEQGTADEMAVLSRHERELPLGGGVLMRLAQLHADKGNQTAAIQVLMRPEVISQPSRSSEGHDARLYLAKLLVWSGRSTELVPLGKRWIEQWHEPWLADRLLQIVALEGPEADAKELATMVVDQHP